MKQRLILAAGVIALCTAVSSEAAVIIDMSQVGADVVAQGSGNLNLAALGPPIPAGTGTAAMSPSSGFLVLVPGSGDVYLPPVSPASFGTLGLATASANTGNVFGLALGQMLLPTGYITGTNLAMTATWAGASNASLGVTPGTYTWSWGAGATADYVQLNVNAAPTPEPETYALFAFGIGATEWLRRRKRKAPNADA